jgi:eukaryotic-like serine/threonine-protein kinase
VTEAEWAAFAAGRLDAEPAAATARHLSSCDECRLRFGWTEPTAETRNSKPNSAPRRRVAATEDAIERGTKLGRYLILDRLGSGGMGVVYVAFDPQLDRKVALKVLRSNLGSDQSRFAARMLREAKAMARLAHPNVIAVHDVGLEGQRVFLAMELVEAGTLKAWLRPKRSWREILALFSGAGRGLAAAHAAGLVHRDFKPDNVLIGADGRARVTDFGLARSATSGEQLPDGGDEPLDEVPEPASPEASLESPLTRAGTMMGTPGYMAPEQCRGEPVDARSDQFGFCASLYEALYRQRAFAGLTPAEVIEDILAGKVREAPADTKVPGWVRRILLRGLRVDREERWPSMDALLGALADDPGLRRRRWLGATAGVVALAALLFAARHFSGEKVRLCEGGERHLAGVWDPPRREAVQRAFAKSGKPWAAHAATETTRALDGYATAWAVARGDACAATRIRGDETEAIMALRMGCLDDRKKELAALTDLFVVADDETVERAVQAVAALPPVSVCADVKMLSAVAPPPADPQLRATLAEERTQLATARARLGAGKYKDGLAAAEAVAPVALRLGYRPLVAETQELVGQLRFKSGDYQGADRAWRDALYAAEEARLDELKSRIAVELANVTVDLHGFADAREWMRFAEAMVRRTGGRGEVQVDLWVQIALVYFRESHYAEAEVAARKAIALASEAAPENPLGRAAAYRTLGDVLDYEGQYDEGLQLLDKARALTESRLGPEHPDVAAILRKEIDAYAMKHDGATALALGKRVLALLQKSLPPEHLQIAQTHTNIAEALGLLGRYDEAIAEERLALPTYERIFGAVSVNVGVSHTNIGYALLQLRRDGEARQHLERAVAIYEKTLPSDAVDLAEPLLRLGQLELAEGRPREAVRRLERALPLRQKDRDPTEMLADIELELARALGSVRHGDPRARALAERARDQWAAAGERTRAQSASAWLAAEKPKG